MGAWEEWNKDQHFLTWWQRLWERLKEFLFPRPRNQGDLY